MSKKIQVNVEKHIQACIDQKKYNELWEIIYQHTSKVAPDFTLTEETIKDVLVKTLQYYEEYLINAEKEIIRLNEVIEEKEKMINSLIQTNIHIGTIDNRPPTEQEVCKALGEYYGREVIFRMNSFHVRMTGETHIIVINNLTDNPHLVEMIGKFYKGKVKE